MLPYKPKPAAIEARTGSEVFFIGDQNSTDDSEALRERQAALIQERFNVSGAVARRLAELAFHNGRAAA